MLQADPSKVSKRAKTRGLPQLGTLGAGNHYCEIQVRTPHSSSFIIMHHASSYYYSSYCRSLICINITLQITIIGGR